MTPKTIDDLLLLLGEGYEPKYLYFWGHRPRSAGVDASCLSQWFPASFISEGQRFPTAEHYMMYRKALLFGDSDSAEAILQADNPGKAKALGRKVRDFNESVWVGNRIEIVGTANRLKFSQNQELGIYLAKTGSKVLVEASPSDRIWGIGLSREEARQTHPAQWKGLNLLGFSLMAVRAELFGT